MITLHIFRYKLTLLLLLILLPIQLFSGPSPMPPDTSFFVLKGSVKDKDSKEPIVFASVYLVSTNISTITTTEGQFIIKIPTRYTEGKIGVSCLGYKNIEVPIPDLEKSQNEIQLQ